MTVVAERPFLLLSVLAVAALAGAPARAELAKSRAAEERILGDDALERRSMDRLPFTRQFVARGLVGPDLTNSIAEAGVPASALLEPLRALAARLDPAELAAADKFRVTWERTFDEDDAPVDFGARVTSLEVTTAKKGVVAISRFRAFAGPTAGQDVFYFADGTLSAPPPIRLPLDEIRITSGYGLRADPLDQPARVQPVVAPSTAAAAPESAAPPPRSEAAQREVARAYAGFGNGEQLGNVRSFGGGGLQTSELDRIMVERRLRRQEEEAKKKADEQAEAERKAVAEKQAAQRAAHPPPPARPSVLYMHEGLDLLAHHGTKVRAAADGFVVLARPDRGYGNAIHVEHERGYLTLYAHLARFAAGIEPGTWVNRGDVIGFVGSTGRSTGAHLHFELLVRGRPADPASGTVPIKLGAADLTRLKRQLGFEQSLRRDPGKNDTAPTLDTSQLAAQRPADKTL